MARCWLRRAACGQPERLPTLAQHVLRWQLDRIITKRTAAAQATARATRNVPVVMAGSGGPAQYEAAFQGWERQRVAAMLLQPTLTQRPAIDLARRHRLPSVSFTPGFAEFGGLMACAADLREVARQARDPADRILRGTPPAQLPVQQAARFDLLLNLRTRWPCG